MIMVDQLIKWPTKIRCFKAGSCHLTTDGPAALKEGTMFVLWREQSLASRARKAQGESPP